MGALSRYPWAAVWGEAGGIALAHGLAEPRVFRFAANPATGQLHVSFDLALSPDTARFAGRAWVDFTIYRFDPTWGFRAAAQATPIVSPTPSPAGCGPSRRGSGFRSPTQVEDHQGGRLRLRRARAARPRRGRLRRAARHRFVPLPPDPRLLPAAGGGRQRAAARPRPAGAGDRPGCGTSTRPAPPCSRRRPRPFYSSAFHDGGGSRFYRWRRQGRSPGARAAPAARCSR